MPGAFTQVFYIRKWVGGMTAKADSDPKRARKRDQASHKDIEVLAALLVVFPQVSRAVFDPETRGLSLAFMCKGPINKSRKRKLQNLYRHSIDVYLGLAGLQKEFAACSWEDMDEFCSFQIERDVASLSTGELDLTVALVAEHIPVLPASEDLAVADDGDLAWPTKLFLQETLDQVKEIQCPRRLVALREGEKVLVFDK